MNPRIELVIFDMTATTVRDDDVVSRSFADALAAVGVSCSREEIRAVIGLARLEGIRLLLAGALGKRPEEAQVRAAYDEFLAQMTAHYRSDPRVQEMPGATEVFRRLKTAGYKIALDTGFSRPVADVILDRLGWRESGVLDATVTSDEVEHGRPHPDLVLEAMRRTGVREVQATAKVGDTPADLQEGMSAGCGLVIGVTNGTHSRAELMCCPHTHLVGNLMELLPLFGISENWQSDKKP
jgi:phosphonatase-like hydrolase